MTSELPASAQALVDALARCPGVIGVVLGGSRARGRARPESDIDLGLYYDAERFDWSAVVPLFAGHEPRGTASPGTWGPWMNGGAWLRVDGRAVDVLLRDAAFVEGIAREAAAGRFSSNYLPGFPHGWHSFMLLGEVFHNVPLAGDVARLKALRAFVDPYPEALRAAVIDRFLYEARFNTILIDKLAGRDEAAYAAGLAYRGVMCLVHVLFALERTYLVNEKGALAVAQTFAPTLASRADEAIRQPSLLARLLDEIEARVRASGVVTSWDGSSFPS